MRWLTRSSISSAGTSASIMIEADDFAGLQDTRNQQRRDMADDLGCALGGEKRVQLRTAFWQCDSQPASLIALSCQVNQLGCSLGIDTERFRDQRAVVRFRLTLA
jgi:hypothetical protein